MIRERISALLTPGPLWWRRTIKSLADLHRILAHVENRQGDYDWWRLNADKVAGWLKRNPTVTDWTTVRCLVHASNGCWFKYGSSRRLEVCLLEALDEIPFGNDSDAWDLVVQAFAEPGDHQETAERILARYRGNHACLDRLVSGAGAPRGWEGIVVVGPGAHRATWELILTDIGRWLGNHREWWRLRRAESVAQAHELPLPLVELWVDEARTRDWQGRHAVVLTYHWFIRGLCRVLVQQRCAEQRTPDLLSALLEALREGPEPRHGCRHLAENVRCHVIEHIAALPPTSAEQALVAVLRRFPTMLEDHEGMFSFGGPGEFWEAMHGLMAVSQDRVEAVLRGLTDELGLTLWPALVSWIRSKPRPFPSSETECDESDWFAHIGGGGGVAD